MIAPILTVQDFKKSVAFYTEKLGFNLDFSMPDASGQDSFGFVSLGDNAIGLSTQNVAGKAGTGVVFMIYVPDDCELDQHYADVQSKGVSIVEEIKDQYWGDRTYSVHDPDGYYLTIAKTIKQVPMEEIIAASRAST